MPELSNLLRQRLGALTASWAVRKTPPIEGCAEVLFDAHPDPDTLTAYAEQLLPQDDRNLVMSHLAACSQCREVVMLSLPEAATAPNRGSVTLPAVRRRRFFWTPGFGLAASAVALAALVGVVIEEFPRKSAPAIQSTKQEARSVPAQPAVADNKAEDKVEPVVPGTLGPVAPSPSNSSGAARNVVVKPPAGEVAANRSATGDRKDLHQVYDVRPNATPAAAGAPAALPLLGIAGVVTGERRDYVNDKMFSDGVASDASGIAGKDLPPAPSPRVMSPAGMFNANTYPQLPDFAGLPTPTPGLVQKRSIAPPATGHSLLGIGTIGHEARLLLQKRPTIAIPANGLSFSNTMGGPGQFNPAKEKNQSVEVPAAVPPAAAESELDRSAFGRRVRSETVIVSGADVSQLSLSWKVAGGKLLKSSDGASWVEAYPSNEGIEFAAVAAHGADVWAGGRDAALFHSHDAGANWERLTLGASASGTIIRIEASGPSVRVKSSSGQSWLSTDGGKSWTRQD